MDTPTSPGWYKDLHDISLERYFDGEAWTESTRPAQGQSAATYPGEAPAPVPAGAGFAAGYGSPGQAGFAPPSPDSTPLHLPAYGIGMVGAVKRFFLRWNQVKGRSSQSEFWWVVLASCIASFVVGLIPIIGPIFGLILFVVTVIPTITLTIRRLHDTNRSGKWFTVPVAYVVTSYAGLGLLLVGLFSGIGNYEAYDSSAPGTAESFEDLDFNPALLASGGALMVVAFIFMIWSIILLAGAPKPEGERFDA